MRKLILFLMILFLVNTFQSLAEFKWTDADGYRYAKVDTGITNIKLTGNADSLLIGGYSGAYCLSFNSGKLDTLRNSHLNYITSDAKAYISDVSGSADQFYFPYEVYKISINDLYDEGATGFLDGGDPYARKNRVSHITFDYSMTDSTVFDSYEGTQSWSENHNNNFYYRKVVRKFINSDNFRFYIYYSFDKKETWQDGEKKNTQKISKIKLTNNSNGNITYIPVGTHEEYHNIQADFNNGSSKVAVSNKNQILVYSTQNLNREFSVDKLSEADAVCIDKNRIFLGDKNKLYVIEVAEEKYTKEFEFKDDFLINDIEVSGSSIFLSTSKGRIIELNYNELTSIYVNATVQSSELSLKTYPNPFDTKINSKFYLPDSGEVEILLLDALGRKVFSINKFYPAGWNNSLINTKDFMPGVYYLVIKTGTAQKIEKVIKMR